MSPQAEQRQSLIRRLISSIAFAEPAGRHAAGILRRLPEAALAIGQTLEERLRALIREVIEEVANEGQAVIVAHAASMALAGREGVLKVLVTASPERARRAAGLGRAGSSCGAAEGGRAHLGPGAGRLFPAVLRPRPRSCRPTTIWSSTPRQCAPEQAVDLIVAAARLTAMRGTP